MNKEKKKISDLVKEKIKKEKVKPIPRWHFLLKHGFLWILLFVLLILGSVAVGVSIFEFADIEWDLQPRLGLGIGRFVMTIFPYFWLIVFGFVGVLAYFNFMATPKGYKYPKYQIIVFGILLIGLFGSALHFGGLARNIRDRAGDTPFLREFVPNHGPMWNNPENGLLAGEIISIDEEDTTITVKAFDGNEWDVDITGVDLPHDKKLQPGQNVKILGEMIDEESFEATEARPWRKGDLLKFGEKVKENFSKDRSKFYTDEGQNSPKDNMPF